MPNYPKHKLGDTVRIIKSGSHHFDIGEIVRITKLYNEDNVNECHYKAHGVDDFWYINDSHCESANLSFFARLKFLFNIWLNS